MERSEVRRGEKQPERNVCNIPGFVFFPLLVSRFLAWFGEGDCTKNLNFGQFLLFVLQLRHEANAK